MYIKIGSFKAECVETKKKSVKYVEWLKSEAKGQIMKNRNENL
jgi:hypothetical protein